MEGEETKASFHEVDSKSDLDSISRTASTTGQDGFGSVAAYDFESARGQIVPERCFYGLRSIPLFVRRISTHLIGGPNDLSGTPNGEVARQWRTSLIRFGPLSGIVAMILMILSLVASLGVLAGSDQTAINRWPTSPSTYIAIFTAIGNLSMRYAAFQGIVVAWWVRALHGSSLTKLHNDWKAGTSIRSAVAAGPQMGWFGLACIFSTLVVVDGPLLQRASNAVSAPYRNHPVTLSFSMVPEMPRDYSGQWRPDAALLQENYFNQTVPLPGGGNASNAILPAIIPGPSIYSEFAVISKWYNDEALTNVVQGCPGICSAKLVAPALAVTSCSSHVRKMDYNTSAPSGPPSYSFIPLDDVAFMIGGVLVVDETNEKIQITTGYSTTAADCSGVFNYTVCLLESAIGEYDVTITGNQMTLDSATNPRILAIANNTLVNRTSLDAAGWHPSTLGGVMNLVNTKWALYSWYTRVNGILQRWQAGETNVALFQWPSVRGSSSCASFKDPMETLMSSFNKLMVYYGHAATQKTPNPNIYSKDPFDAGIQINTTRTGYLIGDHEVYHTNYWYFFGAALAQLICVCLVAPTYWGWWKIGRDVSFSPLEIAKAFEAPILADINSNSSGHDIARACYGRHVQYGAGGERTKLAFADPNAAKTPGQGSVFDV